MEAALCPWRVAGSCRVAGDPARGGVDGPGTRYPGTDLDGCRLRPTRCPPSGAGGEITVLAPGQHVSLLVRGWRYDAGGIE
jgi:hypothetical protein